jgi:hypothetical protein
MQSKFTNGLLAFAVMSSAIIVMAGGVQWAKSPNSNPLDQERKKRNLKDEALTVIDAAPDEVDAEKKAARTKKNERFNKSKRASLLEETKDGEYSGTLLETEPAALPVTSDLIVVGSIQRRQPYLSDNITIVYTELTVQIEDILKDNPSSPIDPYHHLVIDREGGAIRMPNGRIFRYLVAHLGIPEVGKRYVLFLQRETEGDYKLVSGYELTDKTIIPLEDFGDRNSLLDLTEAQFLTVLKEKIAQSQSERERVK